LQSFNELAEDEIAAINMAIGAGDEYDSGFERCVENILLSSYTGVRLKLFKDPKNLVIKGFQRF